MTTVAEAINLAMSRPVNTGPPDPQAAVRFELDRLAPLAPSSAVARHLVGGMGIPCQPIDRADQKPTGDRFGSLDDVLRHYRQNPADGLAIVTGAHLGQTIVAVRATPAAWRQWIADHCVDIRRVTDEEGRQIGEDRFLRDLGSPVLARWTPPPPPPARSVAAVGRAAMERALDAMTHGDAREQATQAVLVCWSAQVVWSVEPTADEAGQDGAQVRFRSKKLASGVELIADGPIPWSLERDDKWTFGADRPPITAPMPQHLVEALGGRWAEPVTA